MLETEPEKIKNYPLYYFIDEWWGTRYRYGGNDKNGVDCSGFCCQVYKQIYDTPLPRTSVQQFETSEHINKKKHLREGDLLFFRQGDKAPISHVGIYLHNNYFVHSASGKGVMISNLNDAYWEERFVRGGRVRK